MKKLFSIAVVLLLTCVFVPKVNAQSDVYTMKSQYNVALDTVTNTGTKYMYVTTTNAHENVSIQAVVTKTSGTAAGYMYIQGSLDGVNYVGNIATTDSAAVSNVTTNTYIFTMSTKAYKYYRLAYTGSGTMVCTLKGYFLSNNPNK